MTERLDIINFLRGFSIFSIVLTHLMQFHNFPMLINKAINFGSSGIHVFILCSGFGLYLSYLHKPLTYRQFIKRRFSKIYFPYIIIVLLSALWEFYLSGFFNWKIVFSHIFLYKMFVPEYECSLGGPFWFISTIIQFYIAWPLLVKIAKMKWGLLLGFIVSYSWATLVVILGYENERVWTCFFLQFLWEFLLGMWLAEKYFTNKQQYFNIKWKYIISGIFIGIPLTALTGLSFLRLYNDILALTGFLSVTLFIYKMNISFINKFFNYTNNISYELFLCHMLVYSIIKYLVNEKNPTVIEDILCFTIAYTYAYLYNIMLKRCKIK